ncbi:MAG: L-serine ammonia-lyase, iron-sulfur-dependent, subunit alpha [Planctomycetes bacterium]|nr:L-serine ammonia-lyase, iron-sulfur-dependent, subunit alpha [Planctomycetota bacterium]MCB9917046.1 L-serine ammonia-lyase, iron-sulfur-dependent, subunit alpha [Planctomycetota bacterium]
MRGPSSSHSAASVRIGRMARDLCGGQPDRVLVEFDTEGSLPTTHKSQGSDMGLFGGLLGWHADDERLPRSGAALREAGVALEIRYALLHDPHPNTYRLTLWRGADVHRVVAISTGGGMIEVIEIDGTAVSLFGDYDVTLLRMHDAGAARAAAGRLADHVDVADTSDALTILGGREFVADDLLLDIDGVVNVHRLSAVLPVRSRKDLSVPFLHAGQLAVHGDLEGQPLSDFALQYECARGGIDVEAVFARMRHIREIIASGVASGLAGTEHPDRVLPRQSHRFAERLASGSLLASGLLNTAILYVTALMEVKSSDGVFVAAPTAGSCGTFAGTCHAAFEQLGTADEPALRAMLAGGLIGVFVATRSSFAAEVGGCQAETGAGAAMAAAALVELGGGSAAQSLSAASHAIQNVLGLVCDPVANRVEAPCLGRNIAGAANAIASANMALSGYDHLIPLDEVLDAHREISERMARELRCTALGGLSITPTSKAIEAKLCGGSAHGGCGNCR